MAKTMSDLKILQNLFFRHVIFLHTCKRRTVTAFGAYEMLETLTANVSLI